MRKIFFLAVFAAYFVPLASVIPIAPDIWLVHYLALLSIFLLGISFVLWQFNPYISVFTALCWFSAVIVTGYHPRALFCVFQIDLACLGMYVVSMLDRRRREIIVRNVCFAAMIQGLWIVVQYFNLDPVFHMLGNEKLSDTVGTIGSRNQAGLFLAVTIPAVTAYYPWMLATSLFGLMMAKTSTTWVAAVAAMAVMVPGVTRKARVFIAVVMAAATALFFLKFESVTSKAVNERIEIAYRSVDDVLNGRVYMEQANRSGTPGTFIKKIVTCHPLFGYGLGNYPRVAPWTQTAYIGTDYPDINAPDGTGTRRGHRYNHAHNDYAEIFFETGILGFFSALSIIASLLFRYIKAEKTRLMKVCFAAVLAHMICALGIFSVHTATSGLLLILFYGCLEGELRNGKNPGVA
jgi:O-antigen ligase